MAELRQIGTVEILRIRTYWLDGDSTEPIHEAIVKPGIYPLYSDGLKHFWLMTGTLSLGGFQRQGDGLITAHSGDIVSNIEVVFPSRTLGPNEFKEILNDPVSTEDNIKQRLRITLNG